MRHCEEQNGKEVRQCVALRLRNSERESMISLVRLKSRSIQVLCCTLKWKEFKGGSWLAASRPSGGEQTDRVSGERESQRPTVAL